MKKQRLELSWIGKDQQPRLEPRILIEDPEKSYGDKNSPNMLIKGDNLLSLKALEQDYTGKVKCVYIDPPYNSGKAFAQYEDGLEHSEWLRLMHPRIQLIHRLLSDEGSLWISIDDYEGHYLKLMCDEVFGRQSFFTSFIWQKVDSPNDNKVAVTPDHEYILCYFKKPGNNIFKPKEDASILSAYNKPDKESDRPYRDRLLKKNGKNSLRSDRPSMYFPIKSPDGADVYPIHDDGREARWAMGKKAVEQLILEEQLIWKKRPSGDGTKWVPYTREYAQETPTRPYPTIWSDVQTMRQAKAHQKALLGLENVFDTPKPEPLLARILQIATNENDLVFDSFLGSGTTAAVAHKMGRRWIGVEIGEHCDSHCLPRLQKVVDGKDSGGVTETTGWQGGGGFKYYTLAPSLLKEDKYGHWVIDPHYNANMLAAAMAKHENFRYLPDEYTFWKHGQSTEKDFIFTTTNFLTVEFLDRIHDEMQEDESLLICCKSFQDACLDRHSHITVKKIPQMLLGRCEFGREDYSLHIITVPSADDSPDEPTLPVKPKPKRRGKAIQQASFLDDLVGEDA